MKKVLVIEDDELVQQVVGKTLERIGLAHVSAITEDATEEGLSQLDTFSAVIVDLIMPFTTGWDVITRIRHSGDKGKTIPIIVLTGAPISKEEKESLLTKVNAVMDKGTYTPLSFKDTIEQWV